MAVTLIEPNRRPARERRGVSCTIAHLPDGDKPTSPSAESAFTWIRSSRPCSLTWPRLVGDGEDDPAAATLDDHAVRPDRQQLRHPTGGVPIFAEEAVPQSSRWWRIR
jgi:hypothetical protein